MRLEQIRDQTIFMRHLQQIKELKKKWILSKGKIITVYRKAKKQHSKNILPFSALRKSFKGDEVHDIGAHSYEQF